MRFALVSFAVASVLSVLAVVARSFVAPFDATGALITLLAPERVAAHERFVVFAGVSTPAPARLLVRLCDERRSCVFERHEPFGAGTTFKWVAAATVPAGAYQVEAFLQVPTVFGHRSVASYRGDVAAR